MTYQYPKTPFSIKDLDLDKVLGICTPGNPRPKLVTHLPPSRSTQLFIKGPIPFSWLKKANAIGGCTGIIAVALWFYAGLHSSRRFRIDSRLDQLCGLSRQTRDQILRRLRDHGLIKLTPKQGAYPTIEIL